MRSIEELEEVFKNQMTLSIQELERNVKLIDKRYKKLIIDNVLIIISLLATIAGLIALSVLAHNPSILVLLSIAEILPLFVAISCIVNFKRDRDLINEDYDKAESKFYTSIDYWFPGLVEEYELSYVYNLYKKDEIINQEVIEPLLKENLTEAQVAEILLLLRAATKSDDPELCYNKVYSFIYSTYDIKLDVLINGNIKNKEGGKSNG